MNFDKDIFFSIIANLNQPLVVIDFDTTNKNFSVNYKNQYFDSFLEKYPSVLQILPLTKINERLENLKSYSTEITFNESDKFSKHLVDFIFIDKKLMAIKFQELSRVVEAEIVTESYLRNLEIHNLKLKRSRDSMTTLLRMLSHDITNFVTIIDGNTKNLLKIINSTDHSDRKQNCLTKINSNTMRIMDLIKDAKDLCTVELLSEDIPLIPTSINEIIEFSISAIDDLLKSKNIKLTINKNFNDINNKKILCHKGLLTNQVLINLLTNAIKFSQPNGEVSINLNILNGQFWELEVVDYGIGIPKEILSELGKSAKNISRSGTQGEKSSGLGLLIAFKSTHMMNGDIQISSQIKSDENSNSGTSVKIRLKAA